MTRYLKTETYFTFISDETEGVNDYEEYGVEYFEIGDELTTNQFNGIISLLRKFAKHSDDIKLGQGTVKGAYGDYTFDIESTTVTDKGILITDETISNLGTVKLENNVFHNSKYTLHLKVYHMSDINVLSNESDDNIVWEELTVDLVPDTDVTIPFTQLDYNYVVIFNATVTIDHDVPVIVEED